MMAADRAIARSHKSGAPRRVLAAGGLALSVAMAGITSAGAAEPLSALRTQALSYVEDGHYGDALNAYQRIAELHPDDAQAHYDLAATMTFIRMYIDAQTPIARARRLAPDEPRFHALAALLHMVLNEHREAFAASLAGAKLGDAQAMFTLVGMYEAGRGTRQDSHEGLRWLIRAAEHEHLSALEMLVAEYTDGGSFARPDAGQARLWKARLEAAERRLNLR
ncbi:MAG: tetratricopeptide repeat protein [Pseudomonadota bacterium]